jgi:hypothetical protein
MRWSVSRNLSVVLITVLITGCASRGTAPPVARNPRATLSSENLWALYVKAVETAKHPQPSAISTALVPIVHSTPGLRWDDQGRILMGTWTKRQYYEGSVGKPFTFTHGAVWLTAVPRLQDFCRSLGLPPAELDMRLRQLLGLPPNASYDAFVQFWVDPKNFFRPCADPEITDRECTLNLTVDDSPTDQCPWKDSFSGQTSATWTQVTQDHLNWMCANWTQSFPANPRDGYPWTGLGYTYDWGQPSPVGQSEFVAPQGTTVVVESITGTVEYCDPLPLH